MAHQTYKSKVIKIDNASGTLTAITGSVNQDSLQGILNLLEDVGMGDSDGTVLPGVHRKTVSLNGWGNSTTEGIFGPLATARTSISKTYEVYNGLKYYNGEVFPGNVQFSGNADDMQVWSADLTFDGAANRTSVGL